MTLYQFPEQSDFQETSNSSSFITSAMGILLSTILYLNTSVIFYKCPPSPSYDYDVYEQFLYQEDTFVILSTPNANIITIEETDY